MGWLVWRYKAKSMRLTTRFPHGVGGRGVRLVLHRMLLEMINTHSLLWVWQSTS